MGNKKSQVIYGVGPQQATTGHRMNRLNGVPSESKRRRREPNGSHGDRAHGVGQPAGIGDRQGGNRDAHELHHPRRPRPIGHQRRPQSAQRRAAGRARRNARRTRWSAGVYGFGAGQAEPPLYDDHGGVHAHHLDHPARSCHRLLGEAVRPCAGRRLRERPGFARRWAPSRRQGGGRSGLGGTGPRPRE